MYHAEPLRLTEGKVAEENGLNLIKANLNIDKTMSLQIYCSQE
jgi:hypothetical protein